MALVAALGCDAQEEGGRAGVEVRECTLQGDAFLAECSATAATTDECAAMASDIVAECESGDVGKADGGVGGFLQNRWLEGGQECFEEGDLDCVEDYFEMAVWGWRHYYDYPDAANALENYLTCEAETYTISYEAFFADTSKNPYFIGFQSLDEITFEATHTAREWLANPEVRADWPQTLDLGDFKFVSNDENVRLAIGRGTISASVTLDWWDEETQRGQLFVDYAFVDHYDFHPDRRDEHSSGKTYSETYPYHAWAVALQEEGRACAYDVVGEYRGELQIDAAWLEGP